MKFKELTEKEMQHVVGGRGKLGALSCSPKIWKKSFE
jgi:bacteriocin-like protein